MNILLIHTADYLHHPLSSRQHYIFEDLAERHTVIVPHFHVGDSDIQRETKAKSVDVTLLPFRTPLNYYLWNAPYQFVAFNNLIRKERIDVIVTSNILASTAAVIAGRINNVPVIFDLSDWLPDSAAAYIDDKTLKHLVHRVVLQITEWNIRNSAAVTTVSPSLVTRVNEWGVKAELITNGVDTSLFDYHDRNEFRGEYLLSPFDYVIGFSGAVERWYDIASMIRAMPEIIEIIPDAKLLVVGGSLFTGYEKELKELVSELHIQDYVIFKGFVPYEKVHEAIACMDLCVIPLSPKDWCDIAFPNKYFEYSSCGKPILATNMPNLKALDDRNLHIYANEEEYIAAVASQPVAIKSDVSMYDWKRKATDIEQLCQRVIRESGKKGE